jgi:hypothetical protein
MPDPDKSLISNYRPISLLSAVGKVFERIVFKEVFNHLISNNLLYKFQSGFSITHFLKHLMTNGIQTFKICKISRTLLGVIWKKSSVAFVLRGKSGFDVLVI